MFEYLEENLKLTQKSMADLAAASDELTEMHQRVCTCITFNCQMEADVYMYIDHLRNHL